MTQPPTPRYRETAATHIRALSALSAKIPTLLTTSATTFSQLTNGPIHPPSMELSPSAPDTPARRRAAISATANAFLTTTLELGNALHAQINDLEKHKVIPPEEVRYSAPAPPPQQPSTGMQTEEHGQPPRDSEATVKNAGLGAFDVGHLNARAGAGREGGEEVLERVRALLEELAKETEKEDEEMVDG